MSNEECLQAINNVAEAIEVGSIDLGIAGGVESMSMVPVMGYKTALNYKLATEHQDYYLSMGLTAEQVAKEFEVTREESISSQRKFHSNNSDGGLSECP